jgi:hypothetical protein
MAIAFVKYYIITYKSLCQKKKRKKKKASPVATPKASSLDPLQHHVAPVFQQLCPVSANAKK